MTGSDYYFGPTWFWKILFVLAVVGFCFLVIAAIFSIVWIAKHIYFV